MIKVLIITIISLFLDGILSLYIGYLPSSLSIFLCNFTLISVLYGKFFINKKWYLLYLIIVSLIYDVMYTNVFLYTSLIYFVIYLVMDKVKIHLSWLYFVFYIFFYNVLNYLLYGLIYEYISVFYLFKVCYSSLIMSTLYISVISLINRNGRVMINDSKRENY